MSVCATGACLPSVATIVSLAFMVVEVLSTTIGDITMELRALSDRELLALLIGKRNAMKLYKGSILSLAIGDADNDPHPTLIAAMEFAERLLLEKIKHGPLLDSPTLVRDYLRLYFMGQEHESFVSIYLDSMHRVRAAEELFRGTLMQTSVYPREVVKAALKHNASAVIFAHNHPSGVAEPSRSDELLTANLKRALALIDVRVLDHFVVGGEAVVSFAERGVM